MFKINFIIRTIPWYVFGALIIIGIANIFLNAENSFVVITSVVSCACFTYMIFSKYSN